MKSGRVFKCPRFSRRKNCPILAFSGKFRCVCSVGCGSAIVSVIIHNMRSVNVMICCVVCFGGGWLCGCVFFLGGNLDEGG